MTNKQRDEILAEARAHLESAPELEVDLAARRRRELLRAAKMDQNDNKGPISDPSDKHSNSADAERENGAAWAAWCDARIAAAIERERARWRKEIDAAVASVDEATGRLGDGLCGAIEKTAARVEQRVNALLQEREAEIVALRRTLAELRALLAANDARVIDAPPASARRVN
jgi:hypothetical protein